MSVIVHNGTKLFEVLGKNGNRFVVADAVGTNTESSLEEMRGFKAYKDTTKILKGNGESMFFQANPEAKVGSRTRWFFKDSIYD